MFVVWLYCTKSEKVMYLTSNNMIKTKSNFIANSINLVNLHRCWKTKLLIILGYIYSYLLC